jgi:hypothetical protein
MQLWQMEIGANSELTEISVPILSDMEIRASLYISGNDKLETLSFPSLVRLEGFENNQNISVNGNINLTSINFPLLEGFYHALNIHDNHELTDITIPNSKFIGKAGSTRTGLLIYSNYKLQLVQVNALEKVYNEIEIFNNYIFDVSSITNCDFFVVNNDGYDCNLGNVNIWGNANNTYCFQDSAKIQQPTLLTTEAIDITQTTATSGGSVDSPQGTIMKRKGVCWSTSQNPTVDDNISDNGYGNDDFNSYIYDLLPNTTYHYRAYAEDCNGIYYGNEMSFTTPQ